MTAHRGWRSVSGAAAFRWRRPHPPSVEPLLAMGLLGAVILAVYWRLLIEGLVLAGYDTQTYFFPYWTYAFNALRDGRVPLWNPSVFLGVPFLANPQAAVFYAPNWLLLPVAPERALGLAVVLHVALAATGALLLARRVLKLTWPAATVAGVVFAFGGFFIGQTGHVNQISAAAWLPWLILGLDRSLAGRRRWWFATPLILALMLLAGHPQEAYIVLVFALFYTLVVGAHCRAAGSAIASQTSESARRAPDWLRRRRPALWLRGGLTGLAVWLAALVGGLLLAAVQLLPTLELSRQSIRSNGLSVGEAASFSLPPDEALLGLLPPFLQLPSSTEFLGYAGIAGLSLAALGVVTRFREPRVWLFAIVTVLAVVVAFGPATPAFGLAHRFLPGFALFRVPPRWMLLSVFGVAMLAAYGTEALAARSAGSWRALLTPLARWVALLGLLAAGALALLTAQPPLPEGVGLAWAVAAALALSLLAVAFSARRPAWRWLAVVVVAAELTAASWPAPIRAAIPDAAYAPAGSVLPAILAQTGQGRLLSLADSSFEVNDRDRAVLASRWLNRIGERSWREFLVATKNRDILNPNLTMAYGLRTPDGYDGGVLPLASYVEFRDALIPGSGRLPDVLIQNQLEVIPSDRVLDALGVQLVVQNRVPTLEFNGAHLDLRFSRRVDRQIRFEGLSLDDVTGVMLLTDASPTGQGVGAGAIDLWDAAGNRARLNLRRSPDHPERITIGPGHLVSARPGLAQPAFLSTASLRRTTSVRRITITPPGGAFDLLSLTLLHTGGSSTAIVVRPGGLAIARVVGDVTLTSRGGSTPRLWLPQRVWLVDEAAVAKRGVAAGGFDSRSEAWLIQAPPRRPASGLRAAGRAVLDALRGLGLVRPGAPSGWLDSKAAATLRREFTAGDGLLRFSGSATATMLEDRAERVVIQVETDGPRLLVLGDAMYPGWTAQVDGSEAEVWQANLAQRAVLIPSAGTHTVVFEYRSVPFEVGRLLSLLTAGAGVLLAVGVLWRRRTA